MFCPKCGSILMPSSDGAKKSVGCSCGYKETEKLSMELKEKTKEGKELAIVDNETDDKMLPTTKDEECPECGHKEAWYWMIQTRAGDEAETKFMKCCECKHVWRDYN